MEFRPCIDIHNGSVKQIVGASLSDEGDTAGENFVSDRDSVYYAKLYEGLGLKGGHIIILNNSKSPYYEASRSQAFAALSACPGFFQVGGGVNAENAAEYLEAGASHVIVTSYVFVDGMIHMDRLEKLVSEVGREHLVLDLSCKFRKAGETRPEGYYIVTDRWQNFTDVLLNTDTLQELAGYADEFLVHAADVEGKSRGIEKDVASLLGKFSGIPVTYAGGVGSYDDITELKTLGMDRVNVTVGSSLDIFGGSLALDRILSMM
ncbi:MAG: phosphoribosylformimino-5-aminoimidazole carboxamide ribotide isomerase [Lachnospiraceae bacterium]|nr:phosphoribosylformimino-5-aminoimidazole carboxamide ribotide isomerase [Lachnospiraceae bacterium]